ncbi:chemotaxis protein CheW [Phenylobacterium sp.]|uniref:chemotaxis protein CheW n=1 Tax=Phenylobacterium sp. TaxID=1871053 RepID=UPI002BEFBBEA|nr:chemotaxis protein CheW [Phenylobacterium sp.]HLZ74157.1 chemotaxis protein CheW [Phenylobacterium sp.]
MGPPALHQGSPRELISFRLAAQDFCVDIMAVREIRGWTPATALPGSPNFVCGVINLRGAVLPIVDLAFRLGFDTTDPTAKHVIIVVELGGRVIGLLVDGVSDILTVTDDAIQPTPDVASDAAKSFVRGLLPGEGRMISLLGLDHIVPQSDLEAA